MDIRPLSMSRSEKAPIELGDISLDSINRPFPDHINFTNSSKGRAAATAKDSTFPLVALSHSPNWSTTPRTNKVSSKATPSRKWVIEYSHLTFILFFI